MPRLETATSISRNTYQLGMEIPRKIAYQVKGNSCATEWIKRGQTVLVRIKKDEPPAQYVLGVMKDNAHRKRRIVSLDNRRLKVKDSRIFTLKGIPIDRIRKLEAINQAWNEEKTSTANINSARKISWNETSQVRVIDIQRNPSVLTDSETSATTETETDSITETIASTTVSTEKSIYQHLKAQKGYRPEEWRYLNVKIGKNDNEMIQSIAFTLRKLTAKHLLKEYRIQKKDIDAIKPDELNDDGLETYDLLRQSLKAFEIEIERRGLDDQKAAETLGL